MKKFFLAITAVVLSISSFAYDPVNEKLIRSFEFNFPNASQVSWQEVEGGFIVSFVKEGVRARASFDAEGNLLRVIRYYEEQQLPYEIQYRVKRMFPKKQIFGVIEVTSTKNAKDVYTEYMIKLEDSKSWTTVRVTESGKVSVTEKFSKN